MPSSARAGTASAASASAAASGGVRRIVRLPSCRRVHAPPAVRRPVENEWTWDFGRARTMGGRRSIGSPPRAVKAPSTNAATGGTGAPAPRPRARGDAPGIRPGPARPTRDQSSTTTRRVRTPPADSRHTRYTPAPSGRPSAARPSHATSCGPAARALEERGHAAPADVEHPHPRRPRRRQGEAHAQRAPRGRERDRGGRRERERSAASPPGSTASGPIALTATVITLTGSHTKSTSTRAVRSPPTGADGAPGGGVHAVVVGHHEHQPSALEPLVVAVGDHGGESGAGAVVGAAPRDGERVHRATGVPPRGASGRGRYRRRRNGRCGRCDCRPPSPAARGRRGARRGCPRRRCARAPRWRRRGRAAAGGPGTSRPPGQPFASVPPKS